MNISLIFQDKRFIGVRIGIAGFLLAATGFLLDLMGMRVFGLTLFGIAWVIVLTGFLFHIAGAKISNKKSGGS